MSDIVERLRSRKSFWLIDDNWMMSTTPDPDCVEAADEIEQLREQLHKSNWGWNCPQCVEYWHGECAKEACAYFRSVHEGPSRERWARYGDNVR